MKEKEIRIPYSKELIGRDVLPHLAILKDKDLINLAILHLYVLKHDILNANALFFFELHLVQTLLILIGQNFRCD